MASEDNIVRCLVNDAIESVAKKGSQAPDRDVLLACWGLMVKELIKKMDDLRWPLWFAGFMVGGSGVVQVVLKILGH